MADNNSVNVSINVTDNGSVDKVNKKVKSLKDLLDQSTTSANALSQSVAGISAPNLNAKSTKAASTASVAGPAVEKGTAGSKKIAESVTPITVNVTDNGSFDLVSKKATGLKSILDRSILSAKTLTQALSGISALNLNLETAKSKIPVEKGTAGSKKISDSVTNVIVTVADQGSFDVVSKKIKGLKDFLDSSVVSAKNLTQALAAVKAPSLETVKAKVAPTETVMEKKSVIVTVADQGSFDLVSKKIKGLKDFLDSSVVSAKNLTQALAAVKAINLTTSTPTPTSTSTSTPTPTPTPQPNTLVTRRVSRPGRSSSPTSQNVSSDPASEYAAQRGVAGITGASARNFAAESQGLGGLVRLYATVAANTYAAAAAFTALSKAMDTTNMVKGLDQLGVSSGVNLGTLSKQLAQASGGAISLQDSMKSVVQATSAGISSDNVLKLGKVAEKASQALGISMPDALSRLSRGVTKLEPELLDELGIFTKIDESSRKYAASLGKSVSALTDFEKRQGFANAVLEEGNKKFGEIKIDANPYSKLLASLQNLTQSGLELVNKVLGPLINMLAESPVALATLMAGIATMLVSKALPAIGQWREGLKQSADAAADSAKRIRASFGDEFQGKLEAHFKIPDLKSGIAQAEKDLAKLNKLQAPTTMPSSLSKLAGATSTDVDAKALAAVNNLIDKRQEKVDTGMRGSKVASDAFIAATKEEIKFLKTKADFIEQEIARNAILEKQNQQKLQLADAQAKLQNKADKPLTRTDPETIAILAAEKADRKRNIMAATSAAAETANIAGVRVAWAELNKTVEKDGITGLAKYTTLAKGGLAAVTSRVLSLAASFSGVAGAFGIVTSVIVAGYQLVNGWFTKNAKEAEETSTALNTLHTSAEFVDNVLLSISKKDPLASISTESITARATALNGLANNVATAFEKVKAQVDKASPWDVFIDGWKTVIGSDLLSVSAKEFSVGIAKQLSAAAPGKEKTKAVKSVKDILGVDPQDVEKVNKVLSESPEKFMQLMPQVSAVMQQFGHELMNVASQGKQLDDAFAAASKTLGTILVAAIPTDPLAKLGMETLTISQEMTKAFEDPTTALNQMASIAGDISKLRFFGNLGLEIQKVAPQIKDSVSIVAALEQNLEKLDKEIATAKEGAKIGSMGVTGYNIESRKEGERLQVARTAVASARDAELKKLQPYQEMFIKAQNDAFIQGAKQIENSIGAGFKQASITVQTALAGLLGDTAGGIQLRASLQKQAIDVQMDQIRATTFLIDSQEKLRIAQEAQTDALRKQDLQGEGGKKLSETERNRQIADIDARTRARTTVSAALEATPANKQVGLLKSYAENAKPVEGRTEEAQRNLTALSQASAGAATTVFSKQANAAQLAQKAAEQTSIKIQEQAQLLQNELKVRNQILASAQDQLNTEKSIFDSQTAGLEYLSQESVAKKANYDLNILLNKQLQERNTLAEKIAEAQSVINNKDATPETRTAAETSKSQYLAEQRMLINKQLGERQTQTEKTRVFEIDNAKKTALAKIDLDKQYYDIANGREQTAQTIKEENIAKLNALGALNPEALAAAQAELEQDKERVRNAEKLAELADKQARTRADFTARLAVAEPGGDTQAIVDAQKASEAAYVANLANEAKLNSARVANNATLAASNALLAQQKTVMDSLVLTTESLAAVFGDVGTAIGNLAQTLQRSADTEKQNLTARIALEQELYDAKDPAAESKALKGLNDLEKKSAKDKQNADLATLNSTKKLFKEKTAAYKALDAIEKVQHVRRIYESNKELITTVMNAGKELAQKLGFMATEETAQVSFRASEIAGTAAANTANATSAIPAIFAKFSAMLGPWGWAAAAAVVAALGLSGGGGGYSGPSEAKLAEASGTGMEYNSDNKLVAREGGVVGDPTAKAESLSKSIDLLGETFFESLDSESSNLIKYLKAIDDNTKGLAKAMLEQAGFFTGGDILGIKEGTDGGGLLGAIFGKTTTTIDRAGLYVQGTLDQLTSLTEGINGAVAEIYANVTVEDSGLFGTGLFGGSTSYRTAQDLGAAGREALEGIFKNWKSALLLTAKGLEGGSDRVEAALKSVGKITLDVVRGEMSATEYATAVMNELSVKMNQATLATMPYIKAFTQIGEEYYEAANRLTKEAATISQGMRMLGKEGISAAGDISGALHKIEVSTAFLDKFEGDLSKGAEAIQFYFDTFQTETQKNTYYATQLADGFKEIGYTTVLTLDQYKAAIASLNINDPGQAAQLANLLKLAPAYDKVNQAQKKTAALQADLLEAEGDATGALALRRKEEYAALSDVDAALQRRIDALGDEKTAYDKLHGALTDTVDGIKTSVKSLRDFSTSILTGPNSLMSPGEKLATLQTSFDKAILSAQGPRDTAEGRKLADQAAQDVVKYGQQLVDSATTMFASGPESQRIINQVASATTGVADKLALAQTDAEKQLTQLEASSGYLKSIDETNQKLLKEYEAARAAAVATDPNTPQKTIGPVIKNATEAPGTAVSNMVAAQQTQLAAQNETNRLLQETIDTQKALLISNAKVIQAQTDALNAAAEERRLAAEYAERNRPTEYVGA